MKAFIKGLVMVTVVFLGVLAFKPCAVHAASSYVDYQEQYNVSPDKVWRVSFNRSVSWASAQNSVFVYDSNNNPVPVKITVDSNNSKVLLVAPNADYALGKRYYMVIKSSVYALGTYKNLKNDVRMYFNISTKYTPTGGSSTLPNDGIVLVENDTYSSTGTIVSSTLRAYSAAYLYNNSNISNDIKSNTNNKIYYVSSLNTSYSYYVQQVFGSGVNTYTSMYSILSLINYQPIVYTDSLGNTYTYAYNSADGQYELQKQSVNVNVNLNSTTATVSLTVNSVMSVPGATYYKMAGSNVVKKIKSQLASGEITGIADTIAFSALGSQQQIYILSANQSVMAYGYINTSTNQTNASYSLTLEDAQPGNTSANSNNNGSAVKGDDGYTYYVNSGDNDTLYKIDNTGDYNMQIGLDRAQYMNISNGWIYYSNYTDGGKIYRIRTDGTQRQKICDDVAAYVVVYGDWIYYSNHSDEGKLYKIGIAGVNGSSSTYSIAVDKTIHGLIVDNIKTSQNIPYDEVAYLNVVNNWIYFVNNSDDHKIYKIDLDGNFRTKVNDEWSTCPQVVDNYVYYCANTGEIKRVDSVGNSNPVDMGAKTGQTGEDQSYHINVSGDWIYYSNKDDNKSLYKVRTDGSGEKYKLTDMAIDYVNVAGDKLYIVANRMEYTLPIDTTGADIPKPVTKGNPDNHVDRVNDMTVIVDYADVNRPIEWIEDKYLPNKVSAFMSDDTIQELTVSWDKVNKTFSGGVYTYTGSILGYDKKVTLRLIIPSEMLNDSNDINVTNNPGAHDIVKISEDMVVPTGRARIKANDIIRIYGDENKQYLLGKGTVSSAQTVTINNLDLDTYGNAFYVTIQRSGKYESKTTKVEQMTPPVVGSKVADDPDSIYIGIDGRDFHLAGWEKEAGWNNNVGYSDPSNMYDNMYILPAGTQLDMNAATPVNVNMDSDPTKSTQIPVGVYNTLGITLDSTVTGDSRLGKPKFKAGDYNIYISRSYQKLNSDSTNSDDYVTADPDGHRPNVFGKIASTDFATENVVDDEVPTAPVIISPKINYGSTIVMNSATNLQLKDAISVGQELWFIPTSAGWDTKFPNGWLAQNYAVGDVGRNKDNIFTSITNVHPGMYINGDGLSKSVSISSLPDGTYYLMLASNVGTSNRPYGIVTIDNVVPTITVSPSSDASNPTTFKVGDTVSAKSNNKKYGTFYIVPDGTDTTSVDSIKLGYTKYTNVSNYIGAISTSGMPVGVYDVVFVDLAGNISSVSTITVTSP